MNVIRRHVLRRATEANANMSWVPYKLWAGNVVQRRIRVPADVSSISALGLSTNALHLRRGAVGTIENILSENSRRPEFVRFSGSKLDLTYAAEVSFERAENAAIVWMDLKTALMKSDSTTVLILRPSLDRMEIEY
jgi:hypothetical protein